MSEKKKGFDLEAELIKNAIPVDPNAEAEDEDELDIEEEEEEEEEEEDEDDKTASVKSDYTAGAVPTVDMSDEDAPSGMKVESLGAKTARKELWSREVNRSSHGASHVKTFIGKLTREAIGYMDEQINTWLANNPEVEVKFVTVVQGDIMGRTREPSLLVCVWV